MKLQPILIAFVAALFLSCTAQEQKLPYLTENTVGVGLLKVSIHSPLPIYANADSDIPYDTITFTRTTSGPEKGTYQFGSSILKERLNPYVMEKGSPDGARGNAIGDYQEPQLIFTVLEAAPDHFTILLNAEGCETAVIKIDKNRPLYTPGAKFDPNHYLSYEDWPTRLKRLQGVYIPDNTPIYERPAGKIKGTVPAQGSYRVSEVNGSWIRIGKIDYNTNMLTDLGWIEWQKDGKIQILMILFFVE